MAFGFLVDIEKPPVLTCKDNGESRIVRPMRSSSRLMAASLPGQSYAFLPPTLEESANYVIGVRGLTKGYLDAFETTTATSQIPGITKHIPHVHHLMRDSM
jgi:hypothetical protein